MEPTKYLTPDVLALFDALCDDAGNWSGTPLLDLDDNPAGRGHLTNLKKAGLVTSCQDEDNRRCYWINFTEAGVALAKTRGKEVKP